MSRITVEQAMVYRGGGRRWLTRGAAINAEARAMHRKHFAGRCWCSKDEPGPYGTPGETCDFHESGYYVRFVRRVARLIAAQDGAAKEQTP